MVLVGNDWVCYEGSDGEFMVSFSGGIFFYFYNWSIGVIIVMVIGLFGGIYMVMVMDMNGCIVI